MDFLKDYEINNKDIIDIMNNNYEDVIANFIYNKENVCEVIEYFKILGITNIKDILINRIDIFLRSKKELEKTFSKFNINTIVNIINDDIANLEYLD